MLAAARDARPARSSSRFSRTAITRTAALMERVRSGARRRRPHRADRHLRRRRRSDRRRDDRGAGRRDPAQRQARRSTSCRELDDVVAALARVARPGDVVITLGAGSIGTCRIAARALVERARPSAGATRMSPVAAPADRRFRRAHVKPARQRRTLAAARRAGRQRAALSPLSPCCAVLPRADADRRTRAHAADRAHRRARQRAAVEGRSAGACSTACAARA